MSGIEQSGRMSLRGPKPATEGGSAPEEEEGGDGGGREGERPASGTLKIR